MKSDEMLETGRFHYEGFPHWHELNRQPPQPTQPLRGPHLTGDSEHPVIHLAEICEVHQEAKVAAKGAPDMAPHDEVSRTFPA
jgi:hypothetical protein